MFDICEWDHVLIYGARLAGQRVREYLAAQAIPVSGFLDRDSSLGRVDGLGVSTARDWAGRHDATRACVIIGLFNYYVDVAEVVVQLQALGYGRVVSLVEFVRQYPQNQPSRYWLVDPRYYEANTQRIEAMRTRLADETSRELLDRIVGTLAAAVFPCRYACLAAAVAFHRLWRVHRRHHWGNARLGTGIRCCGDV